MDTSDRAGDPFMMSLAREHGAPVCTVLIVDDNESNAKLVHAVLAADGHAVRIAGSGAAALGLVRADPPDLILLDVKMPGWMATKYAAPSKRTRARG